MSSASTFDNPGIDYNELAGSDDVRTYRDIDPSPSLLPSGVSVETIAKLTHDKLLHNAEFVRQVHLVASLQELLEFQSKTTPNASIISSLPPPDCSTRRVKGDSSDLPLLHPQPMDCPACYPQTVLWTLAHCKMDPDVNSSAGNKSQPSMQHAICHKDSSLISKEDWKAMHQSAILISHTHIETLDITPYHKYLLEQVKKGTAKKLGKSTSKKPMESTAQQLKLKKTFYRCFFFKEWFMALQELESVAPLMSLCTGYWKADMTLGSVLPDTQLNLPTPASSHGASSRAVTPSNASQAPRSQSSLPPRTHSQSSMPPPAPCSQSSMPPPTPQVHSSIPSHSTRPQPITSRPATPPSPYPTPSNPLMLRLPIPSPPPVTIHQRPHNHHQLHVHHQRRRPGPKPSAGTVQAHHCKVRRGQGMMMTGSRTLVEVSLLPPDLLSSQLSSLVPHFSSCGFLTPTLTPAASYSTIALIRGYPQPRTNESHAPHVPSRQCRLAIFSDTHPHSCHLNHCAHPWLPSTQDQQTSHTTCAKSAMQAGDHVTDREEGGVGNVAARQLGSLPLPPSHLTTPEHVPSSAPTTLYTPVSYKESQVEPNFDDLDQDDSNGDNKGDKHGDGESESDNGDDGDGSRSGVAWPYCHFGFAFSQCRASLSIVFPFPLALCVHTHTLSLPLVAFSPSLALPLVTMDRRRSYLPFKILSSPSYTGCATPRLMSPLSINILFPSHRPSLLSLSRCQDHSSPALSHLQDTVGDRAGHRTVVGGLLSPVAWALLLRSFVIASSRHFGRHHLSSRIRSRVSRSRLRLFAFAPAVAVANASDSGLPLSLCNPCAESSPLRTHTDLAPYNGDNNNDSLLATLKCDDLIAWVTAHDIELQNKRATKKEIIKAIMGAAKLEHPSKEDIQGIIKSCQAKCNTRTA
ncbi:hypothetical protein EDB83DRAFT_2601210 [Lactarius deliciosus]|nr:hypothetical protein EDB83DRAFT_2601210 [Lactarius deliciosus]